MDRRQPSSHLAGWRSSGPWVLNRCAGWSLRWYSAGEFHVFRCLLFLVWPICPRAPLSEPLDPFGTGRTAPTSARCRPSPRPWNTRSNPTRLSRRRVAERGLFRTGRCRFVIYPCRCPRSSSPLRGCRCLAGVPRREKLTACMACLPLFPDSLVRR